VTANEAAGTAGTGGVNCILKQKINFSVQSHYRTNKFIIE